MKEHGVNLALTCVVLAALASAAHATTVYVGCKGSPNTTIQEGVNAAPASGTVIVCPGHYAENVTVTTANLTVRANGSVKLTGTAGWGFDLAANHVTITGFEITGFATGVYVGPGFGYAMINLNNVHGNGTGIGFSYSSGHNWVTANAVYSNSADGIFDYSTAGYDYFVANTVYENGFGAEDPVPISPGQNNGIEISTTTCTTVAECTAYVVGNYVHNNAADGVYLNTASNASVTLNLLSSNGYDGLGLGYSTGNTISANEANGNANNGFEVDSNSTGSLIELNKMSGNTVFDATDHSSGSGPGGVGNTWTKDYCQKASPSALCVAIP